MLQKRLYNLEVMDSNINNMTETNIIENIYIRLLEGTETWVPVPATRHGENIFEIKANQYLDLEEDVSSIWEFFPGDVVKCENREGDIIASELLKFTFPNRKVHQLIFTIVKSLGEVAVNQLPEFAEEIKKLCLDKNIIQRQHPVVKSWLDKNCKR